MKLTTEERLRILEVKVEELATPEPETKCPDGLTPDGDICPRCGGTRAPSGVDGGSWVHYTHPADHDCSHCYRGEVHELDCTCSLCCTKIYDDLDRHSSPTITPDTNLSDSDQESGLSKRELWVADYFYNNTQVMSFEALINCLDIDLATAPPPDTFNPDWDVLKETQENLKAANKEILYLTDGIERNNKSHMDAIRNYCTEVARIRAELATCYEKMEFMFPKLASHWTVKGQPIEAWFSEGKYKGGEAR